MSCTYWSGPCRCAAECAELGCRDIRGGKTGWPPGLLQDDSRGLSRWFASKPDAMRHAREAGAAAAQERAARGLVERDGDLWGVHLTHYRVLVDGAVSKLVFIPGSSAWSGMHGKVYSPSMLAIIRNETATLRRITYLHQSGRLSRRLLAQPEIARAIRLEYGATVAARVSPSRTVVP